MPADAIGGGTASFVRTSGMLLSIGSPVSRDLAQVILKIGSVLLLILSFVDILRGVFALFVLPHVGQLIGHLLAQQPRGLGLVGRLLALIGPLVGGAFIVVGAAAVIVGYRLLQLSPPIPSPQRDRWLVIAAVLTALALVLLSPWYLLAFLLTLVGLLISPTLPPLPPPAQAG